ncbi:hypothetical protein GQ457_06G004970 [Hibiscus cannabinus]
MGLFGILWTIWLCRNESMFNKKDFNEKQISDLTVLRIGCWSRSKWPQAIPSLLSTSYFGKGVDWIK